MSVTVSVDSSLIIPDDISEYNLAIIVVICKNVIWGAYAVLFAAYVLLAHVSLSVVSDTNITVRARLEEVNAAAFITESVFVAIVSVVQNVILGANAVIFGGLGIIANTATAVSSGTDITIKGFLDLINSLRKDKVAVAVDVKGP